MEINGELHASTVTCTWKVSLIRIKREVWKNPEQFWIWWRREQCFTLVGIEIRPSKPETSHWPT
jgi:hypothetical protein